MSAPPVERAVLAAALAYAEWGWPVFPCAARTKRPATPGGFHDATTDPEAIRAWWSRTPSANVAVVTGSASGLLVLDLDGNPKELLHGRVIPPSPTQRTGGGGWQVFFSFPVSVSDVATTRAGVLPCIDTRGRGGYVVAPPSVHPSGKPYRWARAAGPDDLPLAAPPQWLVDALIPAHVPMPAIRPHVDTARADRYVRRAIEEECAALARTPEGIRNEALNRSAFALARFVVAGQAQPEPIIRALAYAAASAGLGAREIGPTIKSAFRARGAAL